MGNKHSDNLTSICYKQHFYDYASFVKQVPHQIPLQTSRRVPHQALLHRQAAALSKS